MTPSPRFDPRFVLLVAVVLALAAAMSPTVDPVPASGTSLVPAPPTAPAGLTASAAPPGPAPTELVPTAPAPAPIPPAPTPAAPAVSWTWRPPLDGTLTVTRPFIPPTTPYGPGHRGVDLSADPGSSAVAAADGRVTFAGPVGGRGVVVVTHGDLRTTYEPVTTAVVAGEWVTAGRQLGKVEPGHPGCPVANCLHWGLRRGETYLDPLLLLAAPLPRLLPLG